MKSYDSPINLTLLLHQRYIDKCIDIGIYLNCVHDDRLPHDIIKHIMTIIWYMRSEPVILFTRLACNEFTNIIVFDIKTEISKLYPTVRFYDDRYPIELNFCDQLIPGSLWDKTYLIKDLQQNERCVNYTHFSGSSYKTNFISWFKDALTNTKFLETQNAV